MALIQCPDCKTQVSSTARTCPNCNSNIQLFIKQLEDSIKADVEKSVNRGVNKFIFFTAIIGAIVYFLLNN